MNNCLSCGQSKPDDALVCPSCQYEDEQAIRAMVVRDCGGTPSLTILVILLIGLWVYRFWQLGWTALPGNLRASALAALFLGFAGMVFGPMRTFGIRSRKKAVVLFLVALATFVPLNFI